MRFALVTFENEDSRRHVREHRQEHRDAISAWMKQQAGAGKLVGGEAFETESVGPVTVRHDASGRAIVSDGAATDPETIGGYVLVEVADRDEAVDIAKSWPTPETIEVRPIWSPE